MRQSAQEATRTVLRRMLGQAGGGLSEQVQPIAQAALRSRVVGNATGEIPFHLRGAVILDTSDVWPAPRPIQPVRLRVRLTTAGTSTTTVKAYDQSSTELGAVSFASGESGTKYDTTMAVDSIPASGGVYVQVTAAGTSAAGLVAVLEYI